VKRSGRDESIQVVIHLCMEAMLGISVELILSQPAKTLCLSYYCLCLLFNKLEKRAEHVLLGSEWGGGEEGDGSRGRNGPNNVCTYE
jgi:hypothetical protein